MKNYSKQREEIIKVIKNSSNHPTAEDIYMQVKAKDPAVSRSTVYRNLGLLAQNNIINKIPMNTGVSRYDYKKSNGNYAVCKICGNVMDFNYNFENNNLKEIIIDQTGIEISNDSITIEGICKNCINN